MARAGRDRVLSELREQIARLEGKSLRPRGNLPFGLIEIDRHLPAGGLALGSLHEIGSGPPGLLDASATLFTAGILARLDGPVLWCLHRRDLFAPGLLTAGLDPGRVIFVETRLESAVLPAVEDCLREKGVAAVVGEAARLRLTPSRRLQLAAEKGWAAQSNRSQEVTAPRGGVPCRSLTSGSGAVPTCSHSGLTEPTPSRQDRPAFFG